MRPEWIGDIEVILFDWGGTLCGTAGEVDVYARGGAAAVRAARDAGIDLSGGDLPSLIDFVRKAGAQREFDPQLRELNLTDALSDWLQTAGRPPAPREALASVADAFWSRWVGCLEPIGPVDHLLAKLKHAGYRLGLVSNTMTPAKWCHAELRRLGFAPYFDGLTFSSEVGRRKPHPSIYEDALAKLDADGSVGRRRILFVGDTAAGDVQGPQQMGMRAAFVCDRTLPEISETLERLKPDLALDRATDLADLLIPSKR
jgi:FMN phosphatase YigB (HAD superfamily)